jgi:hypothetical protein
MPLLITFITVRNTHDAHKSSAKWVCPFDKLMLTTAGKQSATPSITTHINLLRGMGMASTEPNQKK